MNINIFFCSLLYAFVCNGLTCQILEYNFMGKHDYGIEFSVLIINQDVDLGSSSYLRDSLFVINKANRDLIIGGLEGIEIIDRKLKNAENRFKNSEKLNEEYANLQGLLNSRIEIYKTTYERQMEYIGRLDTITNSIHAMHLQDQRSSKKNGLIWGSMRGAILGLIVGVVVSK